MSRELLARQARAGNPAGSKVAPPWRKPLLAWYREHRRHLPWRGSRDPYRVWVSEVMLQQTRVATAIPYYQNFLDRFPDIQTLARARPSDVLVAWAGLGYYRRARNLHAAARLVVRDHGGQVPGEAEFFGLLPGVGRYTTGAVLSIAFDRPLPALDGNVARVLARLHGVGASLRDPKGARRLWSLATALVPGRAPGDWNQALMELGAVLCRPRQPRCGECPVGRWCRARALGRIEAFPPVVPRRAVERVRRAVALVTRGPKVLMVRRDGALLAGLWEPPGVELGNRAGGPVARAALGAALRRLGVRARLEPTGRCVWHTIGHRAIEVEIWRGVLEDPVWRRRDLRWVDPKRRAVAVTALGRKLAETRT
ncbi:MAG TPA: A/G-specific adenine glycosylase [Candidatus Eisenbacteria bacterium]|jgi:A/G-specific adenine glycosylase